MAWWWMMLSITCLLTFLNCLFSIIIVHLITALQVWCLCWLSMCINTETDQQLQATSINPVSDCRASWKLLLWPKCQSRKSQENKEAAAAPMLLQWVKHMYCTDCFCNWSICIQCSNVRKPFFLRDSRKGSIGAGITVTHCWSIRWRILVLTIICRLRSDLNKQVYKLQI